MVRSPFSDYGHMSNGMEFPFGELNLNGVPLNHSPSSNTNMTSINTMGNNMNSINHHNSAPNNNMHQAQMQGMTNMGMINPNSPNQHMGNNGNNGPITPSSLWGSALPFSFDALMSGNVALGQTMPLVTHN